MAYINIDVDLDEFDLDDLVDELLNRWSNPRLKTGKDEKHFENLLKGLIKPGMAQLKTKNGSKVDEWKDELWPEIKQKFTLEQLETFLNS